MKKIIYCVLILAALLFGAYFYFSQLEGPQFNKENCPFCNREVIEKQKFYEDPLTIALCTHKPITEGHCLIIPKRYVERFDLLTEEEILQLGQTIKKVHQASVKAFGTSSYLLLQKNGKEVGQSVSHLHFHYIPRKAGENSRFSFIWNLFFGHFQKPQSQASMDQFIQKMKEEIDA